LFAVVENKSSYKLDNCDSIEEILSTMVNQWNFFSQKLSGLSCNP